MKVPVAIPAPVKVPVATSAPSVKSPSPTMSPTKKPCPQGTTPFIAEKTGKNVCCYAQTGGCDPGYSEWHLVQSDPPPPALIDYCCKSN